MLPDRADRAPNTPLGPKQRHYWLVMRMAQSAGVDLVAAMREGQLTQAEWAGMVTRCRGCDCVEACHRWLADPSDAPRAVPEGCLNGDRLGALRTEGETR
jgi:hypothetical protein